MTVSPDALLLNSTNLATSYIPLDFTYVSYDTEDPFSIAMAICSLIPQGILISYATLMLSRREIETFMMFAGQLMSEIANEIIKRIWKQGRPGEFGSGYGMPSAHSQFVFFYSGYLIAWLFIRATHIPLWNKALRGIGLIAMSISVAYSRVYLTYHTAFQVLVGVAIGGFLGISWMLVIGFFRDIGLVDWVLSLKIAEFFYIKDNALKSKSYVADEYRKWKKEWEEEKKKKKA